MGAPRKPQLPLTGVLRGIEQPIRIDGVEVKGDHVAEAQLPLAAEHDFEPLSQQLLRHQEASREAIAMPLCERTRCLQWAAVEGAIAMHDGIFVKHEMAYLMGASEELDFVIKLGRNGDLVRLTINQSARCEYRCCAG